MLIISSVILQVIWLVLFIQVIGIGIFTVIQGILIILDQCNTMKLS